MLRGGAPVRAPVSDRRGNRVACAVGGPAPAASWGHRGARGVLLQRILLVCNAVLALFLVIRLADTASVSAAAGPAAAWSAAALRTVALPSAPDGASPVPRRFLLHLGADVVAPPLPPDPVELGIVAEPALEFSTVWHSSRTLLVRAMHEPLPATNYRLRFTRELRALDGQVLPVGSSVPLTTPTIGLHEVILEDDPRTSPGRGAVAVRAELDLPAAPEVAGRFLRLRDAQTRAMLPTRVESMAGGGDRLFRLSCTDGELPAVVDVVLGKGATPRRGNVPTLADQVRTVVLREPLELRAITASRDGLQFTFNRSLRDVDPATITLTPATEARFEPEARGLHVRGRFAPGSLVTVDLAAGFPGRGRSSLLVPVRRTVLVPDLPADVSIAGDGEVLSARAEPVLTLRGCNVEEVRLRLRRVYPNNVVRMLQSRDLRVFEPAVERTVPIVARRNEEWSERVDLRTLLGATPLGCYQLEVWHGHDYWPERRLLQVTDLGVTVRAGRDAAAVQVVSIADGHPVPAAQVEVLTPTNQVLATGTADGEGVATLRWPAGGEDRVPYVVQVRSGDDAVYVGLERFAVELADEGLGGRPYLHDGAEAMVWPTRGIVRPGERVEFAVLARDAAGAAVAGAELALAVVAPAGKQFRGLRLRTSGCGLVTGRVDLPGDAPCGPWRAEVADGSGRTIGDAAFEVAAFVPNRLEASVAVVEPPCLGGVLTARVHGNWLDGTAAAGQTARARVRLLRTDFRSADHPGFGFGSGDAPPPGELEPLEAVLDERGDAELRFALPQAAGHQALSALVLAEVIDPSGRPVRAQCEHVALQPGFVLGIRALPDRIDLCAIDAGGASVPAGDARVRVEQRRWQWRYEARGDDRWSWRSFVDGETAYEATVPLAQGSASMALPSLSAPAGSWLVAVAEVGPRSAEQALGSPHRAPDRLRVHAANRPAAGESLELDVAAPAAGRGLVTIETDTVMSAAVLPLQAGHNRLVVPVPAGLLLPNVHAVVTLTRAVRQAGPGEGPAWLLGACDVPLRRDELRTDVRLDVPPEVLPQQQFRVAVDARDATEALVAVVDEGVLGVTGHASPDPLAFLLASRRLAVQGADTGSRLVRGMEFAPRTKTGGDDDDLASLLRGGGVDPQIRPLALFAELPLADGAGAATFQLPAYEGRLRVMVLAAGRQRVGAASASVVVAAPLGLQVAAPRLVAPGDRFTMPVSLRNRLGADATVALEIEAPGAVELPGGKRFEIQVGVGRVATVEVPLRVADGAGGPQPIVVTATCGTTTRTVHADVVVRSVRLPGREFHGVALGVGQWFRVAQGWAAEGLEAELGLDSSPDRQLRPALEAMLEYPYGCCEQTSSRGISLASCAALLPRLQEEGQPVLAALPLVQAAADRVLAMQTSRGGFGWWLGSRGHDGFVTVHALDFLAAAREVGADVSATALARGIARLQDVAAGADDLDLRCHAIEVLARLGGSVQPRLDWLCTQAVSLDARARLATALALLGERRRARDLLDHAEAPPAGRRTANDCFASPVRTDALVLRALLAIDPADASLPARVAVLQQQVLRPHHLTTQETGQALRALADYYRRQPVPQAAPRAVVLVDGLPVPVEAKRANRLPIRPGSILEVAAGGSGFLLLRLRGYAPPEPRDDERLVLHREIVDPATGLPCAQLRRGRVYTVRIHGECADPLRALAFADVLPAGCEPEPAPPEPQRQLERAVRGVPDDPPGPNVVDATVEPRDDRVLLFVDRLPAGRFVIEHRIRAVFPGDFEAPPVQAQAMYDPTLVVTEVGRPRVVVTP